MNLELKTACKVEQQANSTIDHIMARLLSIAAFNLLLALLYSLL